MTSRNSNSSNRDGALRSTAIGLGAFSIALGVAELVAPRAIGRATGMPGREGLIRAYGLREIANGVGLLTSADPRPWLWGRVAGDALDLSTLAAHANRGNPLAPNAGRALWMTTAISVLDIACALLPEPKAEAGNGVQYDYSDRVGLARPPEQMRGAAGDFMVPRDMRTPEPLRAYATS